MYTGFIQLPKNVLCGVLWGCLFCLWMQLQKNKGLYFVLYLLVPQSYCEYLGTNLNTLGACDNGVNQFMCR